MKSLVRKLLRRLMAQPAVAYHEQFVAHEVTQICHDYQLNYQIDDFGNFHISTKGKKNSSPLYFVAHMDHPGFQVLSGNKDKNILKIQFLGSVPDAYFKENIPLIAYPGKIQGTLGKKIPGRKKYTMHVPGGYQKKPEFAVWDLPGVHMEKDRVSGRACDDLAGLAALLSGLIEYQNHNPKYSVSGLVTRAEEVGFQGALAASQAGIFPENSIFISLENSKELPPVQIGKGVVIRSGDRLSQFSSHAVYWLMRLAEENQKTDKSFKFQKALMPGGACEATAFQYHGFQTGALCIPLGNYHNCGPKNKILPEFVSLNDTVNMAKLVTFSSSNLSKLFDFKRQGASRLADLTQVGVQKLQKPVPWK